MMHTRRRLIALGLAAALVGPASAQSAAPAPAASTAQAGAPDTGVIAAIARRWAIDPAHVQLEWGPGPTVTDGPVRLLGSGIRGSFVAEIQGPDGVIRRRVRAGVRRTVAVAARDLSRGTSLARADIAYRDTVVWGAGAPGAVEAGWKTARRIPAGALLDRPAVAPPPAVVAGHAVTVVWRGQGLEVTTRGVAAGTAAAGDRVAVRTESGRRLWGVAVSPDRVEIEGSRK